MSVKVHEAFSIDSFQDRLLWWDDFLGDQLQDEWAISLTATGTAAVIDQQTGGIARLGVPAAADVSQMRWGDIRSLLVSKSLSGEARVKASSVTDVNRRMFSLMFNTDNWLAFFHNFSDDTIFALSETGGVFTVIDTGLTLDTSYHIYRIEAFPTGEVHYYVDGVEVNNSPITTNIPSSYLQPHFYIQSRAGAGAETMDIDYVVVRQEI